MDKENFNSSLPNNFIFEITSIEASTDNICMQAIDHYKTFLTYPDNTIRQIAKAMVGNLTEYYELAHEGSDELHKVALPHLSEIANFMDAKNTPSMDVQSTARIKSFYSVYEKLLGECADKLENKEPIPYTGLAKDIIATRDVLHPRYQFKVEPQLFYRNVYRTILEFMEHIDELSKTDPAYGFEEVDFRKQYDIQKPKIYKFPNDCELDVPNSDFIDYALELKKVPTVFRHLVPLADSLDEQTIINDIKAIQASSGFEKVCDLTLVSELKKQIRKESLILFRNDLEQELLHSFEKDSSMAKDYKSLSPEDFLYIHKFALKPEYRDFVEIINSIDKSVLNGTYTMTLDNNFVGGNTTKAILDEKFEIIEQQQELELLDRVEALDALNLNNFSQNLSIAKKIDYFSRCSKDYMRNPKATGYQSFHLIVKTPFGFYEKQFRTENQDEFAEHGHASHSINYKPHEKINFHWAKVCTPLIPATDENNDIVTPISLEPVNFEKAILLYYHKPFEFFSDGISMELFKKMYPDTSSYYKALNKLTKQNDPDFISRVKKCFKNLFKPVSKKKIQLSKKITSGTNDSTDTNSSHDSR